MKANELRIGNWIFDSSDEQKHFQIEQICKDSYSFKGYYIVFRNGSFKSKLDGGMIEPIPLTPEILKKCGFESYSITGSSFTHWKITDNEQMEDTLWSNGYAIYSSHSGIGIEYLHQLQNLYFALTGEELIVNL